MLLSLKGASFLERPIFIPLLGSAVTWPSSLAMTVIGDPPFRSLAGARRTRFEPNSVKHFTSSDWWLSYHGADPERETMMFVPEDFNSENDRICWPAILAVLAVQMIVFITLSIAVANHSSFATASSADVGVKPLKR